MTSRKSPDNPRLISGSDLKRASEASFSLIETVVAVSLIAILMVEITGVHGNAINFSQYSRKALQATYLAKRMMAQVEYQASIRSPLKDLSINEKDKVFEDAPDFTYSMSVEAMPKSLDFMLKVMSGGLVNMDKKDDDKDSSKQSAGAMLEQIKSSIQTAVGEDPIWVARVAVSWPEGARRSSVDLAMIITDIKKLEATLIPLVQKSTPPATPGLPGQPGDLPQPGQQPGQTQGQTPGLPGQPGAPTTPGGVPNPGQPPVTPQTPSPAPRPSP